MNEQPTFADLDYQGKKRKTRGEEFLERMDSRIPWQRLEERIAGRDRFLACFDRAAGTARLHHGRSARSALLRVWP